MALALKDRIKESSTTTGTGAYSLNGAETGFETFSNIGNGNTTYYCCTDGTNFEIGIGTYSSSGNTLARTTILQSSNSDAAFSWVGGIRVLFCTYPAQKSVFLNADGNLPITNSSSVGGSLAVTGAATVGGTLGVTGATTVGGLVTASAKIDLNGTELILDADADTSITADTDDQIDIKIAGTDQLTIKDGAISPVSDSDIDLGTTSLRYKDAFIDTVTTTGNVIVGGNLTISGDDLLMATNTAGHMLIADGTNFNPIAVTDLTAMTSASGSDTLLIVDATDGALRKVARSVLIDGLAASDAEELVNDTSPELGADLDTNSFNIKFDDAHGILDDSGNEQLIFQKTGSAVNQFEMTNAATDDGTTFLQGPILQAAGGDSNIDLNLLAKGNGVIAVRGNGASAAVQFNCESNSHGQLLIGQPHSASSKNTLRLPTHGADVTTTSDLVSTTIVQTLTNKTLTSPVINTGTFGTSILPTSADGTTLGSATKEFSDLFLADGGQILFGNDQEITLTHVADDGLVLKHVGTGDGKEPSFSFHAGDNDIAANDVLGSIFFKAPDEGAGSDAILVAAGIEAVSEGDFSSSVNTAKLSFKTATSGAATEKMSLSSAGLLTVADDIVIKTGGTIGGANDTDLLTLTSAVLTVAGEVVGTGFTGTLDGVLGGGTAAAATTTALASTTITASGVVDITNATDASDATGDTGALRTEGGVSIAKKLFVGGDTTLAATSFGDANITNVGSIALDSISSDTGNGLAIVFNQAVSPNTHVDTSAGGSTAPDFSQYTNFVWTLTSNLVLTDPGDEVAGQSGVFVLIQDSGGSNTISTAAAQYFVPGATELVLSTTGAAVDVIPYMIQADGKILLGAVQLAFGDV